MREECDTMARKTVMFYLVKMSRASGWLLLVLMILYLLTGYALCGKFGAERLFSVQVSNHLHATLDGPLVVLVVIHAGVSGYLACRRWGWFKGRTRC